MATIALDNLVKRYGQTTVVHGIDLAIQEGEFVGTLLVVAGGDLHRVTRVPQFDEVDPLDDTATGHVEAGDDAFGEHLRILGGVRKTNAGSELPDAEDAKVAQRTQKEAQKEIFLDPFLRPLRNLCVLLYVPGSRFPSV